jgi:pSer/pThr/pTyr-binding forkhead associated (FHA) protein
VTHSRPDAAEAKLPRHPSNGSQVALLVLRGIDGGFRGLESRIRLGESLVLGRSRQCGFAPRITEGGISCAAEVQRLRRMSREHARISFCNLRHVEIENLSRNGTAVNGQRVHRIVMDNLHEQPATIEVAGFRVLMQIILI